MAKQGWLLVWIATAALAASSVPAASASKPAHKSVHVKLALVPLQKAQIGAAGSSLSLAHDSGAVPKLPAGTLNPLLWTSSLETFFSLDSFFLQEKGWVGGYALDYGDAFSGCGCITEIRSSVQRFKTVTGAKKLLAWWKMDDAAVLRPDAELGFVVAAHRFLKGPAVGAKRFAYFTEYRSVRAKPVQMIDERFTDGRYLLQVEIASGTKVGRTLVSKLAKKLAEKLDKRLHLARAGRLHARAAKLPAKLTAGPAPSAPDLSTLVLQPTDLAPGTVTVIDKPSYVLDPFALALSDYQVGYGPAGRYEEGLRQEIQWYPSSNEAAFRSAYDEAFNTALWEPFTGGAPITYVNLDSIGQGDRATILALTLGNPNGGTDYLAIITLSHGQATDFVQAESQTQIQPSDVQTLAQSMATRLDSGVTGESEDPRLGQCFGLTPERCRTSAWKQAEAGFRSGSLETRHIRLLGVAGCRCGSCVGPMPLSLGAL